jgi:hypothetical protein
MKLPMDGGDQRSVVMLGGRQLWRHAGWSDGAPLLAGCREEYHDLQGLIRPGGLAIRSCDRENGLYSKPGVF